MQRVCEWLMEVASEKQKATGDARIEEHIAALGKLQARGRLMDGETFQEVLTTAHFATYFGDALERAFLKDYEYQAGQWDQYVTMDTAPDFRPIDRARMSEPGTLYLRQEKGEMQATSIEDTWYDMEVEEYARQFDVSWHTILNDDLGEIRRTPQRMANMARVWKDSWVSALYDNATTQATLAALGAPWSGTGRLTVANLAIGLTAMMQRVDVGGNQINFRNVHLVIPTILQLQIANILQDLLAYGGPDGNVLGQFLSMSSVHIDPYIATDGADVPWYLFADPSEAAAVTVVTLDGTNGPAVLKKASDIEMMQGSMPSAFGMGSFATGDIEYAVVDVLGGWDDASYVGVTDFRAVYYSSGTTA